MSRWHPTRTRRCFLRLAFVFHSSHSRNGKEQNVSWMSGLVYVHAEQSQSLEFLYTSSFFFHSWSAVPHWTILFLQELSLVAGQSTWIRQKLTVWQIEHPYPTYCHCCAQYSEVRLVKIFIDKPYFSSLFWLWIFFWDQSKLYWPPLANLRPP